MRDRLYIDAIETVLSNSSKILVDVKGGNNLLYLPLDKLMQAAPASVPTPDDATRGASAVVLDNERAATRRSSR